LFSNTCVGDGAPVAGAAAALLGASGAVWIAGGIARFSPGQTQKSLPGWQAFFFLPYRFSIPSGDVKPANFVGLEVARNQCLLLWISGGNLTWTN
jgi:hypothetical protein